MNNDFTKTLSVKIIDNPINQMPAGFVLQPGVEATPDARINFLGTTINNMNAGEAYIINDLDYTTNTSGALSIISDWYGNDISIIKLGVGENLNSDVQVLTLPNRPDKPSPTVNGNSIENVDETMSWRISGGTWAVVEGTSIDELEPGDYQVRITATSTSFISANANVTIV